MATQTELPDPATARTPAEYLERMRQLRLWAGQPSLRGLHRLAGLVTAPSGAVVDALPTSTTSYVLNGRGLPRMPRWEFVGAFVGACLTAAGCPADSIEPEVERWRAAWRVLAAVPAGSSTSVGREPESPAGPQAKSPAGLGPDQREPVRRRAALVGAGAGALATLVVLAAAGAGIALTRADRGESVEPGGGGASPRAAGPGTEVRRGTVRLLSDQQGVDLDLGAVVDQRAAGVDITPWGIGNHLVSKGGAQLARLPEPGPEEYPRCATLPARVRGTQIRGLYDAPGGAGICVWTNAGRTALLTLLEPPSQQTGGLSFGYVVWEPLDATADPQSRRP